MAGAQLAQLRAITYKRRDSWWTVLLVDPLAIHLVRLADRLRWATPNRITALAFLVGLAAAAAFVASAPGAGGPGWLAVGALLYHLAFVLDCVDGKLARWQRRSSVIGGWLDFSLDQIRVVICTLALLGGQDAQTRGGAFALLATVVVALHMFRYLNGSLMERALFDLRGGLATNTHRPPSVDDAEELPEPAGRDVTRAAVPISPGARWGGWLARRRIRLNVYGGIEFQMAVLVGAPLAGALAGRLGASVSRTVLTVVVGACALMVSAEAAQIARFLRAAGRLHRTVTAHSDPRTADGVTRLDADANTDANTGANGHVDARVDGGVPAQRPAITTGSDRPQRQADGAPDVRG